MHEKFLLAALEQARLGRGLCAPNPSVGAVAVQNGVIIAQAWHRGAGTPHAEQLLLAQIPPGTPDITLYITLEPCNHWGKTPPCVDAIISHEIKEVFFAFKDPNPIVAQNDSSGILHQQGIKVTHLPLPIIDEFYKSYAYWTVTRKPWVTVKIAHTFDGKIGQSEGDRLILSNALCAQFTHEMRAASDVILSTARTVELDNPQLNVRLNGQEQARVVAVIDSNLSLNKNALMFSKASHCHIYYNDELTHAKNKFSSESNISYHAIPAKNGFLDLNQVISHLGESGYHDVWVEAGGTIFGSLHVEGLVNRTYLYLVPAILGQRGVNAYSSAGLFSRTHTLSWQAMGDNMIACLDWLED